MILTQAELRQILIYDSETGEFTWRVNRGRRIAAGTRAGSVKRKHCGRVYRKIRIGGRAYLAHRLAWLYLYGEWPKIVDHINNDGLDNRARNLREATVSQNGQNSKITRRNLCGVKGVSRVSPGKWRAQIRVNGKAVLLGPFDTKELAGRAYRDAAKKYFGEFART